MDPRRDHGPVSGGITVAVQAAPKAAEEWAALARRVESLGFDALCVADHPGLTVSPFVALAAAASATRTVRLGTAVVNAGVREPLDVASDVATLALVSAGRAFLGIGAGHTPAEWTAVGRAFPPAAARVERLVEMLPQVVALLRGQVLDHDGAHFSLRGASLACAPSHHVPLLVGANHPRLVRLGAEWADVVEISGLGRTLPDGHFHELRWRPREIDTAVRTFRDAAGSRSTQLGALVQLVVDTDDAGRVAERFLASVAERQPAATLPTVDEVLEAPFVLIGTVADIVAKLVAAKRRWGISRYTVREANVDVMAAVLAALDR
jgi:probable F420-dependent oxidoreductase